jgi:hypothetical protein
VLATRGLGGGPKVADGLREDGADGRCEMEGSEEAVLMLEKRRGLDVVGWLTCADWGEGI